MLGPMWAKARVGGIKTSDTYGRDGSGARRSLGSHRI